MFVTNRNGEKEEVSFDKILRRINRLARMEMSKFYKISPLGENIENKINTTLICQKTISRMYDGIETSELDNLASTVCIAMSVDNPDYEEIAGRLVVSNLHKNTSSSYKQVVETLFQNKRSDDVNFPLVSKEFYELVMEHHSLLENIMDYSRDYSLGFFSIKTLEKSYLLKVNGRIVERPQHLFLRVALGIHGNDFESVKHTYDMLSNKYFTHATPTLYNSGTNRPQLSSCFLAGMDDSVEDIFETIGDLANISKWSGGIGLSIGDIRAENSIIRKTNGMSSGIMPLLKVLNGVSTYINQGGKRPGSFAVYIEPWHKDIFTFLDAKKNHGAEELRARDLFYALWIPDLFMKRVQKNEKWTLFCPDACKGLTQVYGDEFEKLYLKYEADDTIHNKLVINARKVWAAIISSQIETGTPYMLYKDACNIKSNQNNIGTIKSSNLCAEIVEYSDMKETAVCNLASICLPQILEDDIHSPEYSQSPDYTLHKHNLNKLKNQTVKVYTRPDCVYCKLLKRIMDTSNVKYQEIDREEALKLQSLIQVAPSQDPFKTVPQVYVISNTPDSTNSTVDFLGGYTELSEILKPKINYDKLVHITQTLTRNLNKIIDLNFYPTPKCKKSNFNQRPIGIGVQGLADLFIRLRIPFDSDKAKSINKKIFETIYYSSLKTSCEIASEKGTYSSYQGSMISKGIFQFQLWGLEDNDLSGLWDWGGLRSQILKYGVRNSLLIALMPTASTSQIMGNNECIEPYTSNIYLRRTLAGEFMIINKHLLKDLITIGIWNENTKNKILLNKGSVANIKELPQTLKDIYKTVWEIKQKRLIELSADRGPFICQSQSLNLWLSEPNFNSLTTLHFHGWKSGLKTGSYYIRSKPALNAQNFGIDINNEMKLTMELNNIKEPEVCETCSG